MRACGGDEVGVKKLGLRPGSGCDEQSIKRAGTCEEAVLAQ
jgi:hypothetical protein